LIELLRLLLLLPLLPNPRLPPPSVCCLLLVAPGVWCVVLQSGVWWWAGAQPWQLPHLAGLQHRHRTAGSNGQVGHSYTVI